VFKVNADHQRTQILTLAKPVRMGLKGAETFALPEMGKNDTIISKSSRLGCGAGQTARDDFPLRSVREGASMAGRYGRVYGFPAGCKHAR
jgi:hypothetical protein